MTIEEILAKKQYSDIKNAAKVIGIKPNNAAMTLRRPNSKHFKAVTEVMATIIITREMVMEGIAAGFVR